MAGEELPPPSSSCRRPPFGGRFHRLRFAGGEEGDGLIEIALALVVLIPLLLGAFEFAIALCSYQEISDASCRASRWAAVRGSMSCINTPDLTDCNATSAEIQTYVQGIGYTGFSSGSLTATTTWLSASSSPPTSWSNCSSGTCNVPGNEVQVTVSYPLSISIPFWNVKTVTLSSTAVMVIAQ
jgi:Flp pilus assembly protein TadG